MWLAAAVVPWVVPAGASRHRLGVVVNLAIVEAAVVVKVEVLEPAGSSWYVLVDG